MSAVLRKASAATVAAALWTAAVAGCAEQKPLALTGAVGVLAPRPEKITLHELADRLGLRVCQTCRTIATLRNSANTVVIYTEPAGQVYVNRRIVPESSGIQPADGTMQVPLAMVQKIRGFLRPPPARPPVEEVAIVSEREEPQPATLGHVVLDPGHGGRDPGAISVWGDQEKDIVLAVSQMAAEELSRRSVEVTLTRGDDRFIALEDRPAVARQAGADLFVSIHADAAPNRSARGFTVYVSRSAAGASLSVGRAMTRRLSGAGVRSRGVRRADYRVLVHATCPAVLVELGYLSNRSEASRLADGRHQRRLAAAVAAAVVDFLHQKRLRESTAK